MSHEGTAVLLPDFTISWQQNQIARQLNFHNPTHIHYINGLVQERHNSSALAMELLLSCTNQPIYMLHNNVWHNLKNIQKQKEKVIIKFKLLLQQKRGSSPFNHQHINDRKLLETQLHVGQQIFPV